MHLINHYSFEHPSLTDLGEDIYELLASIEFLGSRENDDTLFGVLAILHCSVDQRSCFVFSVAS